MCSLTISCQHLEDTGIVEGTLARGDIVRLLQSTFLAAPVFIARLWYKAACMLKWLVTLVRERTVGLMSARVAMTAGTRPVNSMVAQAGL